MNNRNKPQEQDPGDVLAQLVEEQARTEHYITAVSGILTRYEKIYENANQSIARSNPRIYGAGSYDDFCTFLGQAKHRNARLLAKIGTIIKNLNDREKAGND